MSALPCCVVTVWRRCRSRLSEVTAEVVTRDVSATVNPTSRLLELFYIVKKTSKKPLGSNIITRQFLDTRCHM